MNRPRPIGEAPARAQGAGPPRLRLDLVRRLGVLALINIVPLGVVAWIGHGLAVGTMTLKPGTDPRRLVATLLVIVACCAVLAVSAWIVLPIARWLRDYPAWRRRHGSAALWLLPSIGGWLAWLACWLGCAAAAGIALVVMGSAVWGMIGERLPQSGSPDGLPQSGSPEVRKSLGAGIVRDCSGIG